MPWPWATSCPGWPRRGGHCLASLTGKPATSRSSADGRLRRELPCPGPTRPAPPDADRGNQHPAMVTGSLLVYEEGAPDFSCSMRERAVERRDAGLPSTAPVSSASAHPRGLCRHLPRSRLHSSSTLGQSGAPEQADVGPRRIASGSPPEGLSAVLRRGATCGIPLWRTCARTSPTRQPVRRTSPAMTPVLDREPFAAGSVRSSAPMTPTCEVLGACFTHRWFYGPARAWAEAVDPETGLPSYTLVTRDNETVPTVSSVKPAASSPAPTPRGQAHSTVLYVPLRGFLHELVRRVVQPGALCGVEPTRDGDQPESEATHGDYNQHDQGVLRYLMGLYGDLEQTNRIFGTAFTQDRFDAPRISTGPWMPMPAPMLLPGLDALPQLCRVPGGGGHLPGGLLAAFPGGHQVPPDPGSLRHRPASRFSRPAQRVNSQSTGT